METASIGYCLSLGAFKYTLTTAVPAHMYVWLGARRICAHTYMETHYKYIEVHCERIASA